MSSTTLTTPHTRARAGRRAAAARLDDDALWATKDRMVTALLIVSGAALVAIAWVGASGTTAWDTQLRWTALAMVGVVVVCVGVGIWLLRGFIRVRTETRALRHALGARLARPAVRSGTPDSRSERVTASGMAHHHAPDCLLVVGKTVQPVTGDEGLRACGVCA